MTRTAFEKIAAGLENAIANGEVDPSTYHVHVVSDLDVAAIRKRFKLSQKKFAERFGLSPATVRDWEQGRRRPDRTARVLLRIIEREPEVVERAVRAA